MAFAHTTLPPICRQQHSAEVPVKQTQLAADQGVVIHSTCVVHRVHGPSRALTGTQQISTVVEQTWEQSLGHGCQEGLATCLAQLPHEDLLHCVAHGDHVAFAHPLHCLLHLLLEPSGSRQQLNLQHVMSLQRSQIPGPLRSIVRVRGRRSDEHADVGKRNSMTSKQCQSGEAKFVRAIQCRDDHLETGAVLDPEIIGVVRHLLASHVLLGDRELFNHDQKDVGQQRSTSTAMAVLVVMIGYPVRRTPRVPSNLD
mmetsp:Transcript_126824/g.406071  ORF Transcript_126824/g.406071 Transcript_126824/m.406071 type:complete len:255 (-) Transcript_126824:20-784(-)